MDSQLSLRKKYCRSLLISSFSSGCTETSLSGRLEDEIPRFKREKYLSVKENCVAVFCTFVNVSVLQNPRKRVKKQDRGKLRDFFHSIRYGANGSGRSPNNAYW